MNITNGTDVRFAFTDCTIQILVNNVGSATTMLDYEAEEAYGVAGFKNYAEVRIGLLSQVFPEINDADWKMTGMVVRRHPLGNTEHRCVFSCDTLKLPGILERFLESMREGKLDITHRHHVLGTEPSDYTSGGYL